MDAKSAGKTLEVVNRVQWIARDCQEPQFDASAAVDWIAGAMEADSKLRDGVVLISALLDHAILEHDSRAKPTDDQSA